MRGTIRVVPPERGRSAFVINPGERREEMRGSTLSLLEELLWGIFRNEIPQTVEFSWPLNKVWKGKIQVY
jgi:hypothetical protein